MSAQNNVVTLENTLRKKMVTNNNLQKALTNLQLSSEHRLQMEKKFRTCLQKDIEILKNNNQQSNSSTNSQSNETESEKNELKKQVREYEEKLINLLGKFFLSIVISFLFAFNLNSINNFINLKLMRTGEACKWEQKYVEENTMRQYELNELNAASLPKDAKIAALEKTYQQTAIQIQEARTERLR